MALHRSNQPEEYLLSLIEEHVNDTEYEQPQFALDGLYTEYQDLNKKLKELNEKLDEELENNSNNQDLKNNPDKPPKSLPLKDFLDRLMGDNGQNRKLLETYLSHKADKEKKWNVKNVTFNQPSNIREANAAIRKAVEEMGTEVSTDGSMIRSVAQVKDGTVTVQFLTEGKVSDLEQSPLYNDLMTNIKKAYFDFQKTEENPFKSRSTPQEKFLSAIYEGLKGTNNTSQLLKQQLSKLANTPLTIDSFIREKLPEEDKESLKEFTGDDPLYTQDILSTLVKKIPIYSNYSEPELQNKIKQLLNDNFTYGFGSLNDGVELDDGLVTGFGSLNNSDVQSDDLQIGFEPQSKKNNELPQPQSFENIDPEFLNTLVRAVESYRTETARISIAKTILDKLPKDLPEADLSNKLAKSDSLDLSVALDELYKGMIDDSGLTNLLNKENDEDFFIPTENTSPKDIDKARSAHHNIVFEEINAIAGITQELVVNRTRQAKEFEPSVGQHAHSEDPVNLTENSSIQQYLEDKNKDALETAHKKLAKYKEYELFANTIQLFESNVKASLRAIGNNQNNWHTQKKFFNKKGEVTETLVATIKRNLDRSNDSTEILEKIHDLPTEIIKLVALDMRQRAKNAKKSKKGRVFSWGKSSQTQDDHSAGHLISPNGKAAANVNKKMPQKPDTEVKTLIKACLKHSEIWSRKPDVSNTAYISPAA
ncbi:MAG: hypothetical protein VXW87_03505 [Pseudomonadota bacterium]|nr:hypothetical protein [Pseudomonadota bacterium]